jgi:hypothetical protein
MFRKIMGRVMILLGIVTIIAQAGCVLPGPNAIMVMAAIVNVDITVPLPGRITTATVRLTDDGTALTTATVTVNGTPCIGSGGTYTATLATVVNVGDTVTLSITAPNDVSITKTLTMPSPTTITSPPAPAPLPAVYNASSAIALAWNAVTPTPAVVEIVIPNTYTQSGNDYTQLLAGSATSWSIPANTLTAGQNNPLAPVIISVIPANGGFLSGTEYELGSMFIVGNTAMVPINTN